MTTAASSLVRAVPDAEEFLRDVCEGLSSRPRTLPCKYLYDARGSELFEEISALEEYYPTRAELEIFDAYLPQMARAIGRDALVIEYGCGASVKTRRLLAALESPVGIVAIDISETALRDAARKLSREFAQLEVRAMVADFTASLTLPRFRRGPSKKVVFFPGSTIGNFDRPKARDFLRRQTKLLGAGGGLLVGVDLKKGRDVLEAAYDDRRGVTAEFNLNLLARINRELGADFDLRAFSHRAVYCEDAGRVEMWLIARSDQRVDVGGTVFRIAKGEGICTEHSLKYSVAEFQDLARSAGFALDCVWTDPAERFAVHYGEVIDQR